MFEISPVVRQFLTVLCCNLLSFCVGTSNGWTTINFVELQSENSTFPVGPLTQEQSAFSMSLPYAGCFIGNFAVAPISHALGIKRTIHFFCIPTFLSVLLIVYAKDVYYLYVSKFLGGLVGGGTAVAIPMFIDSISFDHVRGALNSLYDPMYNTGTIVSFILGNYLNCLDQAKVQLIVPVIVTILLFVIPETPNYWAGQNRHKRANKAHKYYKGNLVDPENGEFIAKSAKEQMEKETTYEDFEVESSCFEQFTKLLKSFRSKHARRAFFISFSSLILCFFCGTMMIFIYVTEIFNQTGSPLSEKNSAILSSVTTLIGNIVFANIVERFNRKTLHVGSSLLTAVSFALFGVYCTFGLKQPEYEWAAPVCVLCIIFFGCMGLLSIPYIITIEIFPKEIRDIALAMAISMIWIIMFVAGYIFPFVLSAVGLSTCMYILGSMCIVNAIFGALFIPETRGKSYEEIVALLTK